MIDGGACQNDPRFCPPDDSGMGGGDGGTCIVMGTEAGNCSDGIDNDCDGDTDSGDADCGGTCPGFAVENTLELCTDGIDNDCNGSRDNTMPGMDPNCEPMSCTPGTEPGPDLLETLRPPDECFGDYSWVDTFAPQVGWTFLMIMSDPNKTWSCCPPGCSSLGCGCFNTTMDYSSPINEGYEPSAGFDGGSFAVGSNLDIVQYTNQDTVLRFTFAPDGLSGTYVRTISGVTTTYTCQ